MSRKCTLRSFCVSNLSEHLTQVNFLYFEYFLFNLYSTVLKTFFVVTAFSLFAEVSIFTAVPIILGSNTEGAPSGGVCSGLVSSKAGCLVSSTAGCACTLGGAIGTLYSSSGLSS